MCVCAAQEHLLEILFFAWGSDATTQTYLAFDNFRSLYLEIKHCAFRELGVENCGGLIAFQELAKSEEFARLLSLHGFGILVYFCRVAGLPRFMAARLQVCRAARLESGRAAELHDCRAAGPHNCTAARCRATELQCCGAVLLYGCKDSGLRGCEPAGVRACVSPFGWSTWWCDFLWSYFSYPVWLVKMVAFFYPR